jgi:hypothetical protein
VREVLLLEAENGFERRIPNTSSTCRRYILASVGYVHVFVGIVLSSLDLIGIKFGRPPAEKEIHRDGSPD